jgi:hypothetical protein
MFKPYYGVCNGTDNYKGCGNRGLITTRSRGLCSLCESKRKPPKPKKTKPPKNMAENKKYYAQRIVANMIKNKGKCICENCDDEIKKPIGRNVSHVIGAGANITLYHEAENSFVLCLRCERIWTDGTEGGKTKMRIYEDSEERRMRLTLKYYTQKKPD